MFSWPTVCIFRFYHWFIVYYSSRRNARRLYRKCRTFIYNLYLNILANAYIGTRVHVGSQTIIYNYIHAFVVHLYLHMHAPIIYMHTYTWTRMLIILKHKSHNTAARTPSAWTKYCPCIYNTSRYGQYHGPWRDHRDF